MPHFSSERPLCLAPADAVLDISAIVADLQPEVRKSEIATSREKFSDQERFVSISNIRFTQKRIPHTRYWKVMFGNIAVVHTIVRYKQVLGE
jgi:hypothetical protein